MGATEIAMIGVGGLLAALIAVEFLQPARQFEEVRGWRFKCIAFIPIILAITVAVQVVFAGVIADVKLLPGDRLGLGVGTAVGILVSELLVYWAHRLHHRVAFLWRWVHQLHHSAERMDVFGAAYFHPFEILEGNVVGWLLFNVVLGLSPEAAVLATLWQAFSGVFQHGNIRTPVWLGYFIQRPEAHGVHHQRGVHGYNYANLPLWDLVFGTFMNPREWDGLAGFYSGSSRPTFLMLRGRDVARDQPAVMDPQL
jgi:sterol desaturase/sphingolipid hydroxylase (fatty acid hydroxylase superfamily)